MTARRASELIALATEEVQSASVCRDPVVSVCLITHNQARFVREAIDSVLAQETEFPVEVLIADDASSDGTAEIALDYQRRHPTRVRVLLARENLGHHTGNGRLNFVRTLERCRGRYLALLEGDDAWTDPSKLRRQVELLDRDAACAGTFHETAVTESDGETLRSVMPEHQLEVLTVRDVVSPVIGLHTSSFVFRAAALPRAFPDWFFQVFAADLPLFVWIAQHGLLRRVPGRLSKWRRHPGGITATPAGQGARLHFARIELWQRLRPGLDEADRDAVDSTCDWHRQRIVELVDRLQHERDRLLRPFSTLGRVLLPGPLRSLRTRLRRRWLRP